MNEVGINYKPLNDLIRLLKNKGELRVKKNANYSTKIAF